MIFLNVPESDNVANQCIGRVYRIRQRFAQRIWLITVNHIYDQVNQNWVVDKFVDQIAEMKNVKIFETKTEIEIFFPKQPLYAR